MRKPTECEYNMTANHCEKRIDAKNESLRNQRNAKPTECEYNFSLGKKRIDANKELLRNQQNANIIFLWEKTNRCK